MDQENALVVFRGKQIRRTWHNDEWYFSVVDVVEVLTDSTNPSDYLKKVRKRDEVLSKGWGQIVTPLKIDTPGGPQRINCATPYLPSDTVRYERQKATLVQTEDIGNDYAHKSL